jgi:ABC-type multidrug transport system fused ATPase/permease subunit
MTVTFSQPELMAGTLRRNLDMFGERDDAELNSALRSAGLFSLQSQTDDNRLTLDSQIAAGGGNVSIGQRQVISLAR